MSVACQGREWEEPLVEQREVGMRMEKPEGRSTAVLERSREHSRLFGRGAGAGDGSHRGKGRVSSWLGDLLISSLSQSPGCSSSKPGHHP